MKYKNGSTFRDVVAKRTAMANTQTTTLSQANCRKVFVQRDFSQVGNPFFAPDPAIIVFREVVSNLQPDSQLSWRGRSIGPCSTTPSAHSTLFMLRLRKAPVQRKYEYEGMTCHLCINV